MRSFGSCRATGIKAADHSTTSWSIVAVSDSLVAVTFRKSRYEGKQLVEDGHLITLSLATGSVVTTTHWPAEWHRKRVLAPFYQRLIGVGPYVCCCDGEGYFYGYSDDYLVIKDGKVTARREDNPGGLITAKPSVVLGTNARPVQWRFLTQMAPRPIFKQAAEASSIIRSFREMCSYNDRLRHVVRHRNRWALNLLR